MKISSFNAIGKIGFLLVICGFFMPIAYDQNGFHVARDLINKDESILAFFIYLYIFYLFFSSTILGILVGVFAIMNKHLEQILTKIPIIICVISGLIVYFCCLNGLQLQIGAHMVLTGWIIEVVAQVISEVKQKSIVEG